MDNNNVLIEPVAHPGVDMDEEVKEEQPNVLVIDDEADTVTLLKLVLRSGGFNTMGAYNGKEALEKIKERNPDLVLLDIMMPDMDGWQTYEEVNRITDVPVIVISARSTKEDVVYGLRRGVDDYIIKPFYNAEVVERVRSVLRRYGKKARVSRLVFTHTGLVIDMQIREVTLNDESIHMKPKEYDFLLLLAKRSPEVVPYQVISEVVWEQEYSNTLRKYINYMAFSLRSKLEAVAPGSNLIINFAGWGYKLRS
jgi:two-component system response regulator ResD